MSNPYIEEAEEAILHTYNRYQIVLDRGEGVHLYDVNGKEYLDFAAGIAVQSLGYNNKEYTQALKDQIDKLTHISNLYYSVPMAEAAEKFGNGNLLYTTRLSVEIQGIPYDKIEEFQQFIAKEGLVTGGTGAKVRPVVSCKGTTCQYGLLDSYAISEEIYKRFYEGYRNVALPHKFKIAVGGCPNNCVKPNLNDVGIIGQKIPQVDTDVCKGCKKCAIEAARNHFEQAVDPTLIDCYIYELNAAQLRYQFLLRKFKSQED